MRFPKLSKPSPYRTLTSATTTSNTIALSAATTTASTGISGGKPNKSYSSAGFAFVDNSQGSAAAVRELSRELDLGLGLGLEDGEEEGETVGDLLELQLGRLNRKALEFANCGVADVADKREWLCDREQAELIRVAFECAAGMYEPDVPVEVPGFEVRRMVLREASFGGTAKATGVFLVDRVGDANQTGKAGTGGDGTNNLIPIIVVAVRGTAAAVDCMVNLNGRPRDAGVGSSFHSLHSTILRNQNTEADDNKQYPPTLLPTDHSPIQAHSGFLNGADALEPSLSEDISSLLSSHPHINHILFTGHSAGGAVSSLLFLHFLLHAHTNFAKTKLSSLTFGAPPVLTTNLTSTLLTQPNLGLNLSIVNEFDIVTRVDRRYVLSLVDLYRSIYELPPIERVEEGWEGEEKGPPTLPDLDFEEDGKGVRKSGSGGAKVWKLPRSQYWSVGEVVVLGVRVVEKRNGREKEVGVEGDGDGSLREGLSEGCESEDQEEEEEDEELVLDTVTVSKEEFAKLLFCNVNVHRRIVYRERIQMLAEGRFNGRYG